jgi:hypothetical protein
MNLVIPQRAWSQVWSALMMLPTPCGVCEQADTRDHIVPIARSSAPRMAAWDGGTDERAPASILARLAADARSVLMAAVTMHPQLRSLC